MIRLSGEPVISSDPTVRIHPSAFVDECAVIGAGTQIWHQAQIREGARIGVQCIIGKNAYVDFDVVLGDRVKVQNNCSLYHPLVVEDGVFIGPHVVFTNDRVPRAVNAEGDLKSADDWVRSETRVCAGASIGAGAIILPGLTIGAWAMVGSGSVVTKDVPAHGLVIGNPARLRGYVCKSGHTMAAGDTGRVCPVCGEVLDR